MINYPKSKIIVKILPDSDNNINDYNNLKYEFNKMFDKLKSNFNNRILFSINENNLSFII